MVSQTLRWLLLILVMCAPGVWAAESPGEPTESDWVRQLESVRKAVWDAYVSAPVLGRDRRGRTITDDLREWVMTRKAEATLSQSRDSRLLEEERRKLNLVETYWSSLPSLSQLRISWETLLKRVPAEVEAQSRVRIEYLESRLADRYQQTIEPQDFYRQTLQPLMAAYIDEQGLLAAQAHGPWSSRDKTKYCQEISDNMRAVAGSSADGVKDRNGIQPVQFVSLGTPDDFYPKSQERYGVHGSVVVKVTVTSKACVARVEVLNSSGFPQLDSAALDFAEFGQYKPAQSGGQPVNGAKIFTVTFQLRDSPTPPKLD